MNQPKRLNQETRNLILPQAHIKKLFEILAKNLNSEIFNMMEGLDLGNMSNTQREEIMSKVKQEMVMANAQEVLQRLSDKCVKRCIKNPGTSLDKTEQTCLSNCMDRFMDAWNVVSRAYQQRLMQGK